MSPSIAWDSSRVTWDSIYETNLDENIRNITVLLQ